MYFDGFDPDGPGQDNGNYFGMPVGPEGSGLVIYSVPWDVTSSYGGGSAFAPDAIIGASVQLDFYDSSYPGVWKKGIATLPVDYSIQEQSTLLRDEAVKVIKALESGKSISDDPIRRRVDRINHASADLNAKIEAETGEWISRGKVVALVGGDHSVPFGYIKSLAAHYGQFSVLHIDAHADLRVAYEGFEYSHASIMYNIHKKISGVEKIVQVGLRDISEGENKYIEDNPGIIAYSDEFISDKLFKGSTWDELCELIVSSLSEKVYISFDIDGLSPMYAPNTGTPVPGGLSFNQAAYLIRKIVEKNRKIIGFDLCEVSPQIDNEWDANVGARILFKLCNAALQTKDVDNG